MAIFFRTILDSRYPSRVLMAMLCLCLCGCLGGSVAQQIASSVVTQTADQIVANAVETKEKADAAKGITLQDTTPDEYWGAFLTSGFQSSDSIGDAMPEALKPALTEEPQPKPETSKLVRLEIWNLVIGEEKTSTLEKMRLLGATSLPPKSEWAAWRLAVGGVPGKSNEPITFLIPPELGKMRSGEHAVVELAGVGELSIARYASN